MQAQRHGAHEIPTANQSSEADALVGHLSPRDELKLAGPPVPGQRERRVGVLICSVSGNILENLGGETGGGGVAAKTPVVVSLLVHPNVGWTHPAVHVDAFFSITKPYVRREQNKFLPCLYKSNITKTEEGVCPGISICMRLYTATMHFSP